MIPYTKMPERAPEFLLAPRPPRYLWYPLHLLIQTAARQAAAYHQVFIHEMQAQLARLSTRARQIVVGNSGDDIAGEAPAVVVAAVREVVTEIRRQSSDRQ